MLQKSFTFLAAVLLFCYAAGAAMCQAGQWQLVAPMSSGITGLGAATGPDGRIYAMGGSFSYGNLSSMQAYQPQTNTWTFVASMHSVRDYFGCVTGPDGRIYAMGGRYKASGEAYNTGTNTWSAIAPLPIDIDKEMVNSAALGNDGRIYAFISWQNQGPLYGGLPAPYFPAYLRAYDVATDTWSPAIYPPVTLPGLWFGVASDAAGRIYVAGGQAPDGSSVADVVLFDPLANTWRYVQPMPTARSFFALAPAGDGRLYAIGGTASSQNGTTEVDAYDAVAGTWASVAPPNTPRSGATATMGRDGRVYLMGGWSSAVEVYQPVQTSSGPSVTAASIHAMEGSAFTGGVASFTDTHATNAADFTASIQWGDGQTSSGTVSANGSGGFNMTGSHLYTKAGSYATKITVLAAYGGSGSAIGSAIVADAPLTARGLNIVSSGKTFSGPVATFTDANPYAAASDFTAVIRWGDGSSSAGTIKAMATGGFSVSGAHTFLKFNTYTVTVSIKDAGGSTATANTTLTVKR